MTVQDSRTTDVVPGPRTAGTVPGTDGASWIEPQFARRTRPPSQYWDVETASWTSRSSVPSPRRSD
jgi:hypothetical protein